MDPFISKSKYLNALQCHKLLWYYYHKKDAFPEGDDAQQAIFDQGHEIGQLAKQLFPHGIEVVGDASDFEKVLNDSAKLVHERKPLFEAAFKYKNASIF